MGRSSEAHPNTSSPLSTPRLTNGTSYLSNMSPFLHIVTNHRLDNLLIIMLTNMESNPARTLHHASDQTIRQRLVQTKMTTPIIGGQGMIPAEEGWKLWNEYQAKEPENKKTGDVE